MSLQGLLEQHAQTFLMQNWISVPDGFGGIAWEWTDGAPFHAAVSVVSNTEMLIAQQSGAKTIYKLVFDKKIVLEVGDQVRNADTREMYRITSDSRDMFTPDSSPLQLAQCTAEKVTV